MPRRTWIEYSARAGPLDLYFIGGANCGRCSAMSPTCSGPPRCRRAGRSAICSRPRHFDEPDEVRDLAKQMRARHFRAMRSFSFPHTALRRDGIGASGIWNSSRTYSRSRLLSIARIPGQAFPRHHPRISGAASSNRRSSPRRCSDGYLLDVAYPRHASNAAGAAGYREGQRLLDFSRPEVRAWWWDQHRPLVAAGLTAGGSMAARDRRRRGAARRVGRGAAQPLRPVAPAGLRRGRGARHPDTAAISCCAAPAARACSDSAPCRGRATSTRPSPAWKRRSAPG